MIIKQIGTNWFKGTSGDLVFFADTKGGVMDKYRSHIKKNPPQKRPAEKQIDPKKVAAKIINFEDFIKKPVFPGAA